MNDEHGQLDNGELGGTDQEEPTAGGEPTSGDEDGHLEGPDNETGDDLETGDDETPPDESDETAPPLTRARQQAARYRRELRDVQADRDELAAALWRERVDALGILADPDDLELDPDALHDPDRLRELADELVAAKPHLRSRRIRQRAGQGEGSPSDAVSLADMLRRGA